jgi:hypothetical protein
MQQRKMYVFHFAKLALLLLLAGSLVSSNERDQDDDINPSVKTMDETASELHVIPATKKQQTLADKIFREVVKETKGAKTTLLKAKSTKSKK